MAVFADPAGATFCGWQAAQRQGAQRVNEFGAWAMSQLFTPDPDASAEFYGAVFGWTTEAFQDGVWMFRLPGYVGGEPQQPVSREVVAVLVAAPPARRAGASTSGSRTRTRPSPARRRAAAR